MNKDLDKLLAEPLSPIADDGFSETLAARAHDMNVRRMRVERFGLSALGAAICLIMPFTDVGQAINDWVLNMGEAAAMPLALTAGAAVLSALIARYVMD